MNNLEDTFIERTKKHINLVNEYASILGLQFPGHDNDKLTLLKEGYKYYSKPKEERTEEEQTALDNATLIHITTSPHHPEYWSNTDLTGFTRSNFTPNGIIDATNMTDLYLTEMICDWCAVAEERGNTPLEWFNKVNNIRWKFNEHQQKLIKQTIEEIWKEN